MDEELLKHLATRELKQTILNEAKKVLCERNKIKGTYEATANPLSTTTSTNTSSTNAIHKSEEQGIKRHNSNDINSNDIDSSNDRDEIKQKDEEKEKRKHSSEELLLKENVDLQEEKKNCLYVKPTDINTSFFNLQEFANKYSETCKIYDLGCEAVEYDLLISFLNTFNNEMNYYFSYSNVEKPNEHNKSLLRKMAKVFIDKLIFYCTTPTVVFSERPNDTSGLFDTEIVKHVNNLFNQLERCGDIQDIFKNCIEDIFEAISNFQPNPDSLVSWISRQAFADLVKIIMGNSSKRAQLCIIYAVDLIKKKYEQLNFFQVDNMVVIIELIQYAVSVIADDKQELKTFLYKNEEWYEHLCELLQLLKNCQWSFLFKQLIVVQSFLYVKKRQHFNKNFNDWFNSRIEMTSIRNCSYSRWFKIEIPISMSLFRQFSNN